MNHPSQEADGSRPSQRLSTTEKNEEQHEESDPSSYEDAAPPPDPDDVEKQGTKDLEKTQSNVSIAATLSPIREFFFVCVICLCQFMTQVGLGQCLSVLHFIGDSFDLSNPGDLSWLIAGYSLTVGTFILIAGRFGDVFGYKRMLLIGFTWFSLWSMIAGLSSYANHVLFVFARIFQGIGPAICVTNGLAILGASYGPGPKKNMIFALFGATAPGGAVVGALFASIFNDLLPGSTSWSWAFYSVSITLACIGIVGAFVIPDPPSKTAQEPLREKIKQLDLPGGAIGITALVLFNFAWNQAGVTGWQEPYVYVCLIIGVLLVPVFFWYEIKLSKNPLVPFDILTANVGFVLACVSCGWGCFGVWVYYLWQFFQIIRGASPLLATAWTAPLAVSGAIAAIITGLLLSRIRAAWVMTIALTAFLVGIILIATAPAHQIYWAQTFVCTLVITFGMDMSFPAATVIVSNSLPKRHQGMGASLVNTIVNYSISLALGFAGTVDAHVSKGNELKGYRGAFYMGIGLAGLGLTISIIFLIRSYTWGKEQEMPSGEDEKS